MNVLMKGRERSPSEMKKSTRNLYDTNNTVTLAYL
jgi:hypothetical protein